LDLDIVVAQQCGRNNLWLNIINANFEKTGQYLGIGCSHAVAIGDLDNDGKPDILTTNYDGYNLDQVWQNVGFGGFSPGFQFNEIKRIDNSEAVVLADIDENGFLDIIIARPSQGDYWLNDGDGTFSYGHQSLIVSQGWDVAVGDIDGDLDLDIIIGATTSGSKVFLNSLR